uniref:C2H2-type domain-containing protein n=1 Tax=Rhizophagus irregularis (strain DAOM 181602 / DAOM 197198 / MUCL 43194) TaxID=747089 RepID=U9UQ24_RHIID
MVRYKCQICKRYFSTPSGLRQHANAKHHGRTTTSRPNTFTSHEKSTFQNNNNNIGEMEDIIINEIPTQDADNLESEPRYNLRKRSKSENIEETL